MEQVLDVYKRPYAAENPDESPRQLIKEMRLPLEMEPGREKRIDYEYQRCGTYNIFMACEPLDGRRHVTITERKTKKDWAIFIKEISDIYSTAHKITLVMDNYNTHTPSSFYETFSPEESKRIWDRFEFIYTPKHGSWLNIAEIELSAMQTQCLNRRIDNIEIVKREVTRWQENRNNKNAKIDWQFRTEDARIKLKKLYPSFHD